MTNRSGRTAARRQEILQAALACFVEHGYEDATVADICERAGVSVGTVYHHFGSKARVAGLLFTDLLAQYQQGALAIIEADPHDTEACVKGVVDFHLRWLALHPLEASFLLRNETNEAFALWAKSGDVHHNRDFLRRMSGWYGQQTMEGHLRDIPFDVATVIWTGPAQEWARRKIERGGDKLVAVSDALGDAAWRALRA